jgi:hypothetical protein
MTYEYECPTDRGYEKFKINRKDQNKIFKYRKWVWSINYEYYVKDNHIIMQRIPNVYGCVASTLLLPLGLLLEGLANSKETYMDMVVKAWQAKKYGSFSCDHIYKRDNDDGTFDKLMQAKKAI